MNAQNEIHIPAGGPPQNRPDPEIYRAMGAQNINRMIHDFYAELYESEIKHLFPDDREKAADKSAAFFVFLLGGPPLYQERHGPPKMRQRHLPFKIDHEARKVWLRCFDKTLENADEKYQFPMEYMKDFREFLDQFSSWMVNTK